jgi:hypothetical protein
VAITNTVKPVFRGHLWHKGKWPYTTGDLLKTRLNSYEIVHYRTSKW